MTKGLDSPSQLSIPLLVAGGYDFVGRYISDYAPKTVKPDEYAGYIAAGLKVILVYEDEANDALGGAVTGQAKAAIAAPQLEAIGWPLNRPVHFACDFSPSRPQQVQACIECAQAFADALGRPAGIYGDVNICNAAYDAGIKYCWMFGEGSTAGITVYQVYPWIYLGGNTADPDIAYETDYGQAPFTTQEDDMYATDNKGTYYRLSNYTPLAGQAPNTVTEQFRQVPAADVKASGAFVFGPDVLALWAIHKP